MKTFLLIHSHLESECATAFAAWSGVSSPLRGGDAWAGCAHGDHQVFWQVEAADEAAALALLPAFVAARTAVVPVRPAPIP